MNVLGNASIIAAPDDGGEGRPVVVADDGKELLGCNGARLPEREAMTEVAHPGTASLREGSLVEFRLASPARDAGTGGNQGGVEGGQVEGHAIRQHGAARLAGGAGAAGVDYAVDPPCHAPRLGGLREPDIHAQQLGGGRFGGRPRGDRQVQSGSSQTKAVRFSPAPGWSATKNATNRSGP